MQKIKKLWPYIHGLPRKLTPKGITSKAIGIAGAVTAIAFGLGYAVLIYPGQNLPPNISDTERIELSNSKRDSVLKVIQTFAGLGFILTAYFAWKNSQLTEDKNVTDRFSKAVEMLADERLEMRLGGIYSLERIARDSKEDHPVVMEVLTAFIRERTQIRKPKQNSFLSSYVKQNEGSPEKRIDEDIQSALTVIGRRVAEYDKNQRLNLSHANLEGANLEGANLKSANLLCVNLSGANLENANLESANLENAKLIKTKLSKAILCKAALTRANLSEANLSEANLESTTLHQGILHDADLSEAHLNKADLSRADLKSAHLREANLNEAYLERAIFYKAELPKAILYKTELHKANLSEAYLSGANLKSANLESANLKSANLESADLSMANLSYADLSSAIVSGTIMTDCEGLSPQRKADLKSRGAIFVHGPSF